MNAPEQNDDLMGLLAGLPAADLDAERSREILLRATRKFEGKARRRAKFAAAHVQLVEPTFATMLSFAQIAFTIAQSIFVLHHGIGIWRGPEL